LLESFDIKKKKKSVCKDGSTQKEKDKMALRIGFVGTGGIANWHLGHLSKIEGTKVVSVCDVNKERVEAAAIDWKAKPYTDYERMLNEQELDALYICTPPFAHGDAEISSAERGIHLFIEKPISLSLNKAKEIEISIMKNKIITSVGYQRRYEDTVDKIRFNLKGSIPGLFMGYYLGRIPGVDWWRRKEKSGGQMIEQTTHIFDLARYLFGEVKNVFAVERRGLIEDVKDYNIEDASSVTLVLESGLVGTIYSACFLSYAEKVGMDIYLKDRKIEYDGGIKIIELNQERRISSSTDAGLIEDQVFIEAVKSGDSSNIKSDYSDGLKTLEVTLAANESIKKEKVIKL
jgi:predicted dehydrogenase